MASISVFEESKYVSKLTSEDVMMEEMERFLVGARRHLAAVISVCFGADILPCNCSFIESESVSKSKSE